jgi:putative oxidoreductase
MMNAGRGNDEVILVARILLVALFLIFGWDKLTDFPGNVADMTKVGAPLPVVAAIVAVVVEVFVAAALGLGLLTRPLAIVLTAYTLGTSIIGHHFWSEQGAARVLDEINFFKNISIVGGCLLLYVTGAGRYSIDARLRNVGLRRNWQDPRRIAAPDS